MGSSSSHLTVVYDQSVFRGGERVTGRVLLRILHADKVHANELRLYFKCREHTSVMVRRDGHHGAGGRDGVKTTWVEMNESRDVIAPQEFILFHFDRGMPTLAKGDYVFPFTWCLPINCPASFGFRSDRNHCNLRYTFQASLSSSGALFGQTNHCSQEADLHVEGPSFHVPNTPTVLVPRADRMAICCCFSTGTLFSGGSLSATTLSNGQQLSCLLALENHSTCHVRAVEVVLVEEVSWRARGHVKHMRFERFRQRMSPEQLGLTTAAPLGEKEASLNEAEVLRRVHNSVIESAGALWAIPIQSMTNSYSSHLITVSHTLSIKLCTSFGVNNVQTFTNIVIQSPPAIANRTHHQMGSYEIPNPSAPMAMPADWQPQEFPTLPMAQSVYAPSADDPMIANAVYVPPSAPPAKSEP